MYTIRKQLINENTLNDQDQINIQLSIVILDVNDHVPQFESEHFHFVVSENLPAGSLIGRIQAHDPDIFLNGKISYTLFGHDLIQDENRTMFRIDKDTGELFLLEYELDYETKKEYTLMVEAKDHGDSEATLWPSVPSYADITITVEDVNDQKPQISFTIPNEDRQDGNIQFMNLSNSNLNFGLILFFVFKYRRRKRKLLFYFQNKIVYYNLFDLFRPFSMLTLNSFILPKKNLYQLKCFSVYFIFVIMIKHQTVNFHLNYTLIFVVQPKV